MVFFGSLRSILGGEFCYNSGVKRNRMFMFVSVRVIDDEDELRRVSFYVWVVDYVSDSEIFGMFVV